MVLSLSCSVADSVAKLTNITNNSIGRYFGRRFDTTGIWWLFRLQIATTYFRSLNSVTKLLFSCSVWILLEYPRLVHGANQPASDTAHIVGHACRNLSLSSTNNTLLEWLSTRELAHRCGCHKHPHKAQTLSGCIGLHLHRWGEDEYNRNEIDSHLSGCTFLHSSWKFWLLWALKGVIHWRGIVCEVLARYPRLN